MLTSQGARAHASAISTEPNSNALPKPLPPRPVNIYDEKVLDSRPPPVSHTTTAPASHSVAPPQRSPGKVVPVSTNPSGFQASPIPTRDNPKVPPPEIAKLIAGSRQEAFPFRAPLAPPPVLRKLFFSTVPQGPLGPLKTGRSHRERALPKYVSGVAYASGGLHHIQQQR